MDATTSADLDAPGPSRRPLIAERTGPAPAARPSRLRRLFAPVDIASLACFRIAFGALMLVDVIRYFPAIEDTFIDPTFHFTYYGFAWIHPWPGDGMYIHFAVLGLAAVCISLGLFYRLAATVFFLGFSYVFLLEQARYLNHFYLIALISLLLIFVPAHRALSVDAWLRPGLRARTAPAWALWLVRAQIAIPYIYGGIAKLNADWLHAYPLRTWLARRAERPVVGPLLAQEWVAYAFSYGGLVFDLAVVPLLLWRRTRPYAFVAALLFNLINGVVFTIGIFPWVMAAATLMFFEPDWPRRLVARVRRLFGAEPRTELPPAEPPPPRLGPAHHATAGLLGAWLAFQLLFPLRHWLYPGDVAWTEEGHKFSWRMKLRDKQGTVRFIATDPDTGRTWEVPIREHLRGWQRKEMNRRPEMILQFAHHLADLLRAQGHPRIELRAKSALSLNGRRPAPLLDPTVDLAAQPRSLWPAPYILPLAVPPVWADDLADEPAEAPAEAP